jgi:hypothetical protein
LSTVAETTKVVVAGLAAEALPAAPSRAPVVSRALSTFTTGLRMMFKFLSLVKETLVNDLTAKLRERRPVTA